MATEILKDSTSHSPFFELVDSTTGLPKTGIVYTDVTGSYCRSRGARVAVTMASLASASAAYSSGGFILVDDTNQPGVYRFDVPNAAFATGAEEVVITIKATGCRTVSRSFTLTDISMQTAKVPATIAAGDIATDAIDAASVKADAVTKIQNGLSTYAGGDTSGTTMLLSRIGSSVTISGGKVAATIATGDIADISAARAAKIDNADVATSTRMATYTQPTGFLAATFPSDPADASDIAASFSAVNGTLTTIAGYIDTEVAAIKAKTDQLTFTVANQVDSNALSGGGGLDAAGVRSAIGLASANLDTQLSAIDDYIDTEIAAIKAKTDNLPASPAATGDIPSAASNASAVRIELTTELARIDVATSTRLASGSYTSPDNSTISTINTKLGTPASSVSADIAAVKTDTGNLVTRITSTLFSGITSLAQWLGLLAGKQTGNSTARTELRATGAGSGTFDETADSLEAVGDKVMLAASYTAPPSAATNAAAVMASEGDTGVSLSKVTEMLAALAAGKVTASSSSGVTTLTYKKRDGTTTSFTVVVTESDKTRATTGSLS